MQKAFQIFLIHKKIKNNSKSINKTELINSSSNKSNKYRKTIMSYITKCDTPLNKFKK